ncbi:MAG: Fur family transcriptional regulator [Pseudomonadales bacterium]|jgi:Fur family zinc uptake transcriptional regulator
MSARSIQAAERLCADRGLIFTTLRRQVYALIAACDKPVGAYDLLEQLKAERARPAPVTVYRALDFLLEAGLIHRIDALQAYAACEIESPGHEHSHGGIVLVCSQCKRLTEFEDAALEALIAKSAARHGFAVAHRLIEIRGTCDHCPVPE